MSNFNIQLYSVCERMGKDPLSGLSELSDMGFKGVEFAGYYDLTAKEMKAELAKRNLNPLSSHVAIALLRENLMKEIEYLKEVGCKHIVCPTSDMDTEEKALDLAKELNEIGKICYENGLTFHYHNHAHEFKMDNGKIPLDVFYENTDSKYVKAQLDVYWVKMGNQDPYEYVKKYADRMELVHLKQFKDGENCDSPDGEIDFKKVVDLSGAIGIYEQEGLNDTDMPRIKRTADHFKKIFG